MRSWPMFGIVATRNIYHCLLHELSACWLTSGLKTNTRYEVVYKIYYFLGSWQHH